MKKTRVRGSQMQIVKAAVSAQKKTLIAMQLTVPLAAVVKSIEMQKLLVRVFHKQDPS